MTLCCNWIEYRQLMLIKDCKEGQPKLAQNQESKPIQDLIFLRWMSIILFLKILNSIIRLIQLPIKRYMKKTKMII